MKVRIVFSVELSEEAQQAWMQAYGVEKGDLREDVKRHIGNHLSDDDFKDRIGVPISISWK